ISSSAARATRSGIRQAPSRIEYSEWTCRWTKGASAMLEPRYRPVLTGPVGALRRTSERPRRFSSADQLSALVGGGKPPVGCDERRLCGLRDDDVCRVVDAQPELEADLERGRGE